MYKKIRNYVVFNFISASIYRNAALIAQHPQMFDNYMNIIDKSRLPEYRQAHLLNELIDAMGYF